MRNTLLVGVCGLFLLSACSGRSGKISREELPVMDMDKSYQRREVPVQELGETRYISLESSDDALLGEGMRLAASEKALVFYDFTGEGDVIGFDSEGHLISHFNHKGPGVNEYTDAFKVVYDGDNEWIHLVSFGGGKQRLLTFDLAGNCLRSNPLPDTITINDMALLDSRSLLVWDTKHFKVIKDGQISKLAENGPEPNPFPFALLSTDDARLTSRLPLSLPGHFRPLVFMVVDGQPFVQMARTQHVIPSREGLLLNDFVSDTTYILSKEGEVKPILARIPSIHKNVQKGKVCDVLAAGSRYTLIKVIWLDPEEADRHSGLRTALYLWDSEAKDFTECTLRNADWKGQEGDLTPFAISGDKLYFRYFPHQLMEAKENGRLSGELETLARTLEEDDNIILMEVSL